MGESGSDATGVCMAFMHVRMQVRTYAINMCAVDFVITYLGLYPSAEALCSFSSEELGTVEGKQMNFCVNAEEWQACPLKGVACCM